MVLGVEGKPPASDQLQSVRTKALAKLQELGSGAILKEDIDRLKTSDEYVSR